MDVFLDTLDVDRLNSDLLIGVLTITNAAKAKLPARPALIERIRDRLEVEALGRTERLLAGLT